MINNGMRGGVSQVVRSYAEANNKYMNNYDENKEYLFLEYLENFLVMEMKKTKIKMNVPIYIGFTILEVSKMVMWNFFYDYLKPKYGDKIELCYTDTDSFILHIKTEDFYKDIADAVEEWFDTSNYEID